MLLVVGIKTTASVRVVTESPIHPHYHQVLVRAIICHSTQKEKKVSEKIGREEKGGGEKGRDTRRLHKHWRSITFVSSCSRRQGHTRNRSWSHRSSRRFGSCYQTLHFLLISNLFGLSRFQFLRRDNGGRWGGKEGKRERGEIFKIPPFKVHGQFKQIGDVPTKINGA